MAVLYYHAQAETLRYIRHLISFACNGTLQLLAISSIVRGSIYRYLNQYLCIWVSVWRFNETVREFQDSVKVAEQLAVREEPESRALFNTILILPQMEVVAKDTLAFLSLLPCNSARPSVSTCALPIQTRSLSWCLHTHCQCQFCGI